MTLSKVKKYKLLKNSIVAVSIRVLASLLAIGTTILLSRIMGVEQYGIYVFVFSIISILSIVSVFGFDRLAIRETSSLVEKKQTSELKGFIKYSNILTLSLSITIALLALIINVLFLKSPDPQVNHVFRLALLLLPITSLILIRQSILQGLHKYIQGQLPEILFRPIFLVLILLFFYYLLSSKITAIIALAALLVSSFLSLMIGYYLINKNLSSDIKKAVPVFRAKEWLTSSFPLFLMSGFFIINSQSNIILLGMIKSTREAALFSVANQLALLISFTLTAINIYFAPRIAAMFAKKEMTTMQIQITSIARIGLFTSLPIFLLLFFFGHFVLPIYGHSFSEATLALKILSIGYLLNVIFGLSGLTLNMTKYEKYSAISVGIAAIINISLNIFLIPKYGLNGAAIAATTSMAFWNIHLAIVVWKKLKINSTPI